MKKLFTFFLALVAGVGTMFAASGICGDNLTWDLTDGVLTISGTGAMFDYTDGPQWEDHQDITSVIIGNGVTSIGSKAFYNCATFTSVSIPNSVTSIGDWAFGNCIGLTSIIIPNSVTSIGEAAFKYCSGLTSVTIGNSVTSIGEYAFYYCTGLTSVTIPNSVTSIGNVAFSGCSGLTSVIIGNGVTSIGYYAFDECTGLTSITIPNSVTSIGEYAFYYCTGLTSITCLNEIPAELGGNAFYRGCTIYVPCGTLDAYKEAWSAYASYIRYAPSPYTITEKAENGYVYTTEFTICTSSVTCTANPYIGCYFVQWADGVTENPRTIELTQDTTMEAIFDYLLTGKCGKDSALTWTFEPSTMALNITGKGELTDNYTYGAFIESLTVGNEITAIGQDAFYRFNNLKTIIIGSSVKVLEEYAFAYCSSIETITCYGQRPPTVNQNALDGLDYSTIVYVPADYLNTYKMHDAWGLYDVRPIGAEKADTDEVQVNPGDNSVDIVWPTVTGAATYELIIRDKNGNVICTLIFNAQGQLTSIAFAPSVNAPQHTQAAGFSFTVTGLEEGSWYNYTLTSKNESGTILKVEEGTFRTKSLEAVDEVSDGQSRCTKFFRDGQILIQKGENTFDLRGQEVK